MRSVLSFRNIMLRRLFAVEYLVPFVWLLGILAGKHTALKVTSDISHLFFSAATRDGNFLAGIVYSFAWIFFVYIVLCRKPVLILPFIFAKSWLLGFSGTGCSLAFGSAGWLIRILLLFSSFIHSVILLLLCYDRLLSKHAVSRKHLFGFFSATIFVEFLDYFIISRFLISLF